MRKIKLLFLIDSLNPGGAQQQLYELMKGLDKNKFSICVISWYPGTFFQHLLKEESVEWIDLKRKSRFDLGPLRAAWSKIRAGQVDILHAYLDSGCFYGAICKFFFRKLVFIATERSSFKKLTLLQRMHKPISHALANVTVANSFAGKRYLEKLGVNKAKVIVIQNGINVERLASHDREFDQQEKTVFSDQKRIVLMVGRITQLKNQLGVLQAFEQSEAKNNFVLLFVGDADHKYGSMVHEFIDHYNLKEKAFLLNATENISSYYRLAEIIILFSDYEGSPNVILEAMASEKPIISSDVGDVSLFVDASCGWILPPGDIKSLTETFNSLSSKSSQDLSSMGLAAKKKFDTLQLTISAMVTQHEQLYSNLLVRN